MDWQPIETAPRAPGGKNGQIGPLILIWDGKSIGVAADQKVGRGRNAARWWRYFAGADEAEFSDYGQAPICKNPTHWMPLPTPPQS